MDRLLASEAFRHAGQLRHLLAYLSEQSLRGVAGALKEYTVGIEALQRPESYDPRKDATVRIQIGRLRTKIEEYYRTEGQLNPVRFHLPKGGFRLQLETREVHPGAIRSPTGAANRWKFVSLVLFILFLAVCGLLAAVWNRSPQHRAGAPEKDLLAFWQPFFRAGRPPLVVVGPNLFIRMDGIVVRDWLVNRWEDVQKSPRLRAVQRAAGARTVLPMPVYMGTGEARALFSLGKIFFRGGHDLQLRQSSEISWSDFQDRSVILLGSTKSIPHLSELPDLGIDLVFQTEVSSIEATKPGPGEPAHYRCARHPETGQITSTYGLITRLAARRGRGDLIEISSPDTEGSLAAADYITSAEGIRELMRKLPRPVMMAPSSFQVVVRATVKEHVPIRVSYQTHRVLAEPEP